MREFHVDPPSEGQVPFYNIWGGLSALGGKPTTLEIMLLAALAALSFRRIEELGRIAYGFLDLSKRAHEGFKPRFGFVEVRPLGRQSYSGLKAARLIGEMCRATGVTSLSP